MPTPTFANLPAAKRDAFLTAAIAEFAAHDVASASVSRIVATLGIAKGSVYQYFADKQDLYAHLVDHFFAALRQLMAQTVTAAHAHPREAALLERAYRDRASLPTDVLARGLAARHTRLTELVDGAQRRGEVDPAADPELVVLVVGQIGPWLDARLPPGGAGRYDAPEVARLFDQAVGLLRHGLAGAAQPASSSPTT